MRVNPAEVNATFFKKVSEEQFGDIEIERILKLGINQLARTHRLETIRELVDHVIRAERIAVKYELERVRKR